MAFFKLILISGFVISGSLSASVNENRWIWGRDRGTNSKPLHGPGSADEGRVNFDRVARDRYDVREPTTRRPYTGEFSNDDYGDIEDTRNQNSNRYPSSGSRIGVIPPPDGRLPPVITDLRPNPQNGILVGPGGPTGIIGRPNQQTILAPNSLRPNPANGILVGPGGPTGIIGRPPTLPIGGNTNVGPQVFPNVGIGGVNGIYPRPAGGYYPQRPPLGPINPSQGGINPIPYPPPGSGIFPSFGGTGQQGIFPGGGQGQFFPPGSTAYDRPQSYYLTQYGQNGAGGGGIGGIFVPYRRSGSTVETFADEDDKDYDERSALGKSGISSKNIDKSDSPKSINDKINRGKTR